MTSLLKRAGIVLGAFAIVAAGLVAAAPASADDKPAGTPHLILVRSARLELRTTMPQMRGQIDTRRGSLQAKVWRVKVGRCDLLLLFRGFVLGLDLGQLP